MRLDTELLYRRTIDDCVAVAAEMAADDVLKLPVGVLAEALTLRLARRASQTPEG